jgi:hypothetical protein
MSGSEQRELEGNAKEKVQREGGGGERHAHNEIVVEVQGDSRLSTQP